MTARPWLPVAGLVLAMIIWASSFVALKLSFAGFSPMAVIFGRMAVATLCFMPFLGSFRRNVRYVAGDWRPLLLMAFCEPCMYFVFESWALTQTSASQAGMIVSMLPLLVAVAAWFILGERVSGRTFAGFGMAIAGAILLSAAGAATETAPAPAFGNFLEFLAMVSATGYTVLLKRLCLRYPPLFLTAVQAWLGTAFFLPLMLLVPGPLAPAPALLPAAAVLYLGVFVTLGAYALYNYGVSRIPASRAAAFTNLIPVFAVILGRLVLGETFTIPQYLASALVLGGVLLSQPKT